MAMTNVLARSRTAIGLNTRPPGIEHSLSKSKANLPGAVWLRRIGAAPSKFRPSVAAKPYCEAWDDTKDRNDGLPTEARGGKVGMGY